MAAFDMDDFSYTDGEDVVTIQNGAGFRVGVPLTTLFSMPSEQLKHIFDLHDDKMADKLRD